MLEILLCRLLVTERTKVATRLTDKLKRASGVTARLTAQIEARADALIAMEGEIERKAEQAFAPHEAVLSSHVRDLDEVEAALRQLSNADPSDAQEPRSSAQQQRD